MGRCSSLPLVEAVPTVAGEGAAIVPPAYLGTQGYAMLTNQMKHQVFLRLRANNYRASLRLEGLVPPPAGAKPAATLNPAVSNRRRARCKCRAHCAGS
jgi:hypothetical protein